MWYLMHREPSVTLRGPLAVVCLVLLMVSSAGCYHHHVIVMRDETPNASALSPATEKESKTVVQLGWKLGKTIHRIPNCHGQGLAVMWVESNLFFDIVKVATLGFVAPAKFVWQCASPDATDDVIGALDSTNQQRNHGRSIPPHP